LDFMISSSIRMKRAGDSELSANEAPRHDLSRGTV
jgi:hypothetical protein